ncbi:hypothetical protein [Roseixanthobacter glucoisosaccharinicivorans]|uniref:hypothetical protein n=1 Tax=Roseixanthobacter glucoisosaccharinicivorans TaxID=3119923 RepID=UPI003729B650
MTAHPAFARTVVARTLVVRTAAARATGAWAVAAGLLAAVAVPSVSAHAETCLEQIVALQKRVDAVQGKPAAPRPEPQSVGAQLDQQPTPGSVAAASGNLPPPVGPAAALNAAENFQAAGDEAKCLKAVGEARDMLEGR